MTRSEHVERAVAVSLQRHAEMLNAAVGVSSLRLDLKFDPDTGLAKKVILSLESCNFVASRDLHGYVFEGDPTPAI